MAQFTRLLYLLVVAALLLPGVAAARTINISIVDVDYLKMGGKPAINITFDQSISYTTHFPTDYGRQITVQFNVNKRASTNLASLRQVLKAPVSRSMPLSEVIFTVEDSLTQIELRFRKIVEFSLSQVFGPNSITVVMEKIIVKEPAVELVPIVKELPLIANAGPIAKIFKQGKRRLTDGDNKLAIKIFSKVLSFPKNHYTQDALELLGVARERNGQSAQTRLIYKQYLRLYPDGENTHRVRQRLADLMAGEIKPQARLKAKGRKTKTRRSALTTGSVSQAYYYARTAVDGGNSQTDQSLLSTQLSASWRLREAGKESRAAFFGSHDYDKLEDQSGDFKIGSLYYKFKDIQMGYYLTLGRQSSTAAGVLGRFDGAYLAYDIAPTMKVSLSSGYPVNTSRKDRVQQEKVFYSLSLEIDNVWKDWFIAPYFLSQEIYDIQDRQTVGTEARYFSKQGNIFSLFDYDTSFSEMNIFLFRGQYQLTDKLTLLLSQDQRKSPLVETSNALISENGVDNIFDLLITKSEDQIRQQALENTGNSTVTTVGFSNKNANSWDVSGDYTRASYLFKSDTGNIRSSQSIIYFQGVKSKLLQKFDTLILSFRHTSADEYIENQISTSHRMIFKKLRFQSRLRWSRRDSDGNIRTQKIKPSVKFDYRKYKNINILLNIGLETESSSGRVTGQDYDTWLIDIGYRWNL